MTRMGDDDDHGDKEASRCDVCKFDRVAWRDVPQCILQSFGDVIRDVFVKPMDDWKSALLHEDRIYYIVAVLLTIFAFLSSTRRILY